MALWQFNVAAAVAGTASPTSPAFESLAAQPLQGVTTADFAVTYPREQLYGWDGGGDQEMMGRPRAELALQWVWASGANERAIGFTFAPSGGASMLSAVNDERNYYLLVNQDHIDANGHVDAGSRVVALGLGVLTRYDFSAQVGAPTVASATIDGLNLLIQPSGSGQPLPAVHKQSGTALTGRYTLPTPSQTVGSYFEAMPGSIVLTFDTGSALGVLLSGQNACPVDSFGFTIDLPRTDAQELGWAYPAARPVQWPALVSIRANAALNQFQLDALNRGNCPDTGYAFTVGFKNSCSTQGDMSFRFVGAKLESETMAVSVGGGVAKVSFNWALPINDPARLGASPNAYVWTAGTGYTSLVFPQVGYVSGTPPLTFNLGTSCFLSILSGPGLLSGNSVFVTDEAATVVVRCQATDGSDTEDVTVTVN